MDKDGKIGHFVNKTIAACLAGTVLLLVSPQYAFGQWTIGPNATVNVSSTDEDNHTGLTRTGTGTFSVAAGNTFTFGAAGNVLTITDYAQVGVIPSLGNITTSANRGGRLIFDLRHGTTDLEIIGNIGGSATNSRLTAVEIQGSGGRLVVGDVFAGTLTIDENQALTADRIEVVTLTNNGTLTLTSGADTSTVSTLGGSGDITSSRNLTIGSTAPGGFNGTITIDNNATLTVNGRASLGEVNAENGTFIVGSNAIVALDIVKSLFDSIQNTVNGILEVYGDFSGLNQGAPIATFNMGPNGDIVCVSIFHRLLITGGAITYDGRRDYANMSDGYLAALTMHHRYTAWNMVRDRLISGNGRSHGHGYGYRGQADCFVCDPPSLCDCIAKRAWGNVTGRYNTYRSSFNNRNWNTSTGGGQIGLDLFKTPRFQSGLLFGYEDSRSRNGGDRLKANDCYFGFYGVHLFRGGADARIVYAHGWQDYNLDRMGHANGLYPSSFRGLTSEANIELGKRVPLGCGSLRPVLAVDVYNNTLKGTTEKGGADAVKYDKTNLSQVFFRTGTDLRHRTKDYTINSGIYYAYDVNGAALKTIARSAANPDDVYAPLVGTKLGRSLLMFNLGAEGEVLKNFSAFFGYQGEYVMDSANGALHSIGHVGFIGKW